MLAENEASLKEGTKNPAALNRCTFGETLAAAFGEGNPLLWRGKGGTFRCVQKSIDSDSHCGQF